MSSVMLLYWRSVAECLSPSRSTSHSLNLRNRDRESNCIYHQANIQCLNTNNLVEEKEWESARIIILVLERQELSLR